MYLFGVFLKSHFSPQWGPKLSVDLSGDQKKRYLNKQKYKETKQNIRKESEELPYPSLTITFLLPSNQ